MTSREINPKGGQAGWCWGGVLTAAANSHQWRVLARERATSNPFHSGMADQPGRILPPQGSLQQVYHSLTTLNPSAQGSGETNTKKEFY